LVPTDQTADIILESLFDYRESFSVIFHLPKTYIINFTATRNHK